MTSLIRHAIRWVVMVAFVGLVVGDRPVAAAPIASLVYIETALGGGLFQYDYTLQNLADPATDADDAGRDIWDLFIALPAADTLVSATTPAGWDIFGGVGFDFLELVSQIPGAFPTGTDIATGTSLAGLSLVFNQSVGNLAYSVTFVNPVGPEENVPYSGTSTVSTVPEPASLLLLGSGLGFLLLTRRRRHSE